MDAGQYLSTRCPSFEMKRQTPTPAQSEPHHFAELVCSNSLKSKSRLNPAGLLKSEMKAMGSLTIAAAEQSEVPAGEALAVDRELFSGFITRALQNHPKIQTVDACIQSVDQVFGYGVDAVVIATGPLTAQELADDLRRKTDSESLYFYDAIAPILDGDGIDHSIAFLRIVKHAQLRVMHILKICRMVTRKTAKARLSKVITSTYRSTKTNILLSSKPYWPARKFLTMISKSRAF